MTDSKEIREVYRRIKAANNKLIEAFAKKHNKDEKIIKENVKYCLYENLKPRQICDKRPLKGKKDIFHYHVRRLCVIEYSIIFIGKCYIPEIEHIYTEEEAHKRYGRRS